MSKKKQSSVEWLVEKFAKYYAIHQLEEEIEQAKEMHEKQMVDFAYKHTDWGNPIDEIIKDYNETFNNDAKK